MQLARLGAVAAIATIALGAVVTLTAPAVHADPINETTTNSESSPAGDAAPDHQASVAARPQTLQFKIGRFSISNAR
jgi:hypothetical protein